MHTDHRYVEQSLAMLDKVLASHACPPAGHIFWSVLQRGVTFFTDELPLHIVTEEMQVFPLYACQDHGQELTALRQEHERLLEMVATFTHWLGLVQARPNEADWAILRAHGLTLAQALGEHLRHEDAVLEALKRAVSA